MEKIVFATSNPNKIKEVKELLNNQFEIIGLKDIDCHEDIPETQPTIEGNALQKARYVVDNYGVNCFAEDTGLEIESLKTQNPNILDICRAIQFATFESRGVPRTVRS